MSKGGEKMADKNTTSNINLAAAEELPKAQSKFKEFVKKFMKRKTAVISLAFIVFIILMAIIGPYVVPYDPQAPDYTAMMQGPSAAHIWGTNEYGQDVFSRLMMDRVIFLGTEVNDYTANVIQAQLLYLDSTDTGKDISIYINSPGGSVYAGLGIYDTMQYVASDVSTLCTGIAASMAAVLLVAGEKGKRFALKHSRVMIHQPMGGAQGQASDIEITAREIKKLKDELYHIIADHSGQPFDKVEKDSDRDYWMTSQEALDYGMIDRVLVKAKK